MDRKDWIILGTGILIGLVLGGCHMRLKITDDTTGCERVLLTTGDKKP